MMQGLRLNPLVAEDSVTVYWDKPIWKICFEKDSDFSYQIFLNRIPVIQTKRTHGILEGLLTETEYDILVQCISEGKRILAEGSCRVKTGQVKHRIDISQAPYKAAGDGVTINTAVIQRAIDDCGPHDVIYIPAGIYLTGALWLHDHMELYLDDGAVLQGSENPEDYLPRIPSRFEGLEMECYQSLLNLGRLDHNDGYTSKHVRIRGKGTISGGGRVLAERIMNAERVRLSEYIASLGDKVLECENENTIPGRGRGRLINLSNAEAVWISGLTLQNGPGWNVHMIYSRQIVTDHCTFRSEDIWNGDGWDPDSSSDCTIFACTFYTGDDSIAIKSGKNPEGNRIARPCCNIRVFDCKCAYGHGLAIGSEISGGIENVKIWDCDFGDSLYGIEIKGTKKRGGFVRNIQVFDCTVSRILMHAVLYNDDGESASTPPVFENCSFEGLHILGQYLDRKRSYHPCKAVELCGFDVPGYEIKNVTFRKTKVKNGTVPLKSAVSMEYCNQIYFRD